MKGQQPFIHGGSTGTNGYNANSGPTAKLLGWEYLLFARGISTSIWDVGA